VSGEPMFNQSGRFLGYRGIGMETTAHHAGATPPESESAA